MSDDVAGVLFRHRERLKEIGNVLSRYGFARLADHAAEAGEPGIAGRIFTRMADPQLASISAGQRLRGALSELGTTWIKLGQMLSLRPDLVGPDVAAELAQLQADVPADPPGTAEQTIKTDLGRDVSEVFSSFEVAPMASASVAQAHRAKLPDGTAVVVKVVHSGARARVRDDLELMRALAGYVESHDETLAAYSPSVVVDEFDTMMRAAVDLRQELANLQQFTANFADEPDIVIPTPYAELCGPDVLTMSLVTGQKVTGRDSVTATGWEVDELVRRASNVYLEMVFRDGIYHADPHPGNFLLPDGQHLAILDFGDVGRLTGARKVQLEDLLFRVLVRLQGMGGALGAQVSLTELLQPYLRKMAADRLDPRTMGRRAVRTLRGWQRVLADAPRTIQPLLQHLKDGTVRVELEIHDADGVADRLTDGLLGSASLLASAQLLSRGTGPRIGPVSAPGAIALAVGVLTWRRLVRGRVGYQSSLSRVQQLIRPIHE